VTRAASAPARRMPGVKRERSPRREHKVNRRQSVCVGLLALLLLGVVLVHVWLRLQVVKTGYVLATATKLQTRLEQENRELQIELATLTSPDRLESLARRRLGLVPPEKGQVIILP
jgi:cell division protein FtsL